MGRKIPFRELGGTFMEVLERWDNLLAYLVDNRERIPNTGQMPKVLGEIWQ